MSQRRFIPLFLFLPALLLFWRLAYAPFWNPDEGRYAAASREMAFGLGEHKPDWLIPHLNTITRLNKPPLLYWLTGGSFRLWGPSEWSGRLVPALAALAVLFVLFVWGRAAFGTRAGLIAALVWATSLLPFVMARTLNTDMLLTAAITAALWGLRGIVKGQACGTVVAGLGMGLALLAKGPVGVALPLGVFAVYAVVTRKSEKMPTRSLLVALGLTLLVGLPWYLIAQKERPDFLHSFLFSENLARLSRPKDSHQKTPMWYYLPVVLGGLAPWTGFLCGVFSCRVQSEGEQSERLFLWLWAGLIVGFFSLSSTRSMSYVLPAFPAIALLMGAALAKWEMWSAKSRGLALGTTLFLQIALLLTLTILPARDKVTREFGLKPGILRDDKILPRSEGEQFLWPLGAVLVVGSLALLVAARQGRAFGVVAAQGVTVGALYVMVAPLAGRIALYEDGSALFTALRPILKPEDRIASYKTFLPSGMFYAERPITQFDFGNSSGLPPQELAASPWFKRTKPRDLAPYLEAKERVFWITRRPAPDALAARLVFWGRNNDFFLYCNRPKPADFALDFVAPLKRHIPARRQKERN